jgi:WD40 repeat protein
MDVTDPAHPRPLASPHRHQNHRHRPDRFSPDGTSWLLAAATHHPLWDVTAPARPRAVGQPLTGSSAVNSAAFSPDGHRLATGSNDGTTRIWNLNVQYAVQRICTTAGDLTPRQWNQYIPQLEYQPSCLH